MNNRRPDPSSQLPIIYLLLALLAGLLAAAALVVAARPVAAGGQDDTWYGFYVDATSYEPGQTIEIHASAPDAETIFRLVRLDADWTEITRTQPITVGLQKSLVGSFIEYPTVSLSQRISFTLEGWYFPTLLGGDISVVAGQVGLTEAAAGIVISDTGQLGAYVSDTPATDLSRLALAPEPGDFSNWLDRWHHLAMTYDGAKVILYVDGQDVASRDQTGPVAKVDAPFRLGARSEAPGDLTGVIDGRLDSWALWPVALTTEQIEARRQLALTVADPAPDPALVDLYVGFDDPYPSIGDQSHHGHPGVAVNHGAPGLSGVYSDTGRAFRLNHDQFVDADWPVTAVLTVPPGTASGMYAVQALPGPDFTPTQEGAQLTTRAIAIRPPVGGPHAPIAVVLPTNTWLAYNYYPQGYDQYLDGKGITPRSRFPGGSTLPGGNNSAYSHMGDHVSLALYHGWLRPAQTMSPIKPSPTIGEYSVRAPNSMYMVQWLDAQGFAYDVYSDEDFSAGSIKAENHRVLMPHSHHEYWTDAMLAELAQFLDDGGSVAAPAGNIFTWRAVFSDNTVLEVRKANLMQVLNRSDLNGGIDGQFMGTLRLASACNQSGDNYLSLGVEIHLINPCSDKPFCFGQWQAQNTSHWLWRGSGLADQDYFGVGRPASVGTPTYAVGHEADTWLAGMPVPGLAPGTQPVILAEGTRFDPLGIGDTGGYSNLLSRIGETPTCGPDDDDIESPIAAPALAPTTEHRAGTILYFRHAGGGHVLVIGASATPWALESDASLSGLLQRGLTCFAYDRGCGLDVFLPAVLKAP